jgi:hypothetical protein
VWFVCHICSPDRCLANQVFLCLFLKVFLQNSENLGLLSNI